MIYILLTIVIALLLFLGYQTLVKKEERISEAELATLQSDLRHSEEELQRLRREEELLEAEKNELQVALSLAETTKAQEAQHNERLVAALQANLESREAELSALKSDLRNLQKEKTDLQSALSAIGEKLQQTEKNLAEAKSSQDSLSNLLEEKFRGITTKIIDERAEQIHARSEESLKPLREDLKRFGEQVQNAYSNESRERQSLKTQIQMLVEHSEKMSQEANSLTKALKGDNKVQGDWGEMILENILSASGLRKGEEYTLQDTIRDEAGHVVKNEDSGSTMRPDAIIHYPNGSQVIIDSKVSLKAFSEYVAAETEEEREKALKEHLQSVRQQISLLASKDYHAYVEESADFVMLFIPNEPAYILAMKEDPSLWEEAYKKNVVLINSTNLLAALRMAKDLWQRDTQMKNVQKIFEEVGKLYDKFVGYVSSFKEVEDSLQKASNSLVKAKGQLSEGSGNIIRRIENLKKMGAKTSKQLPPHLRPDDLEDE